MRISNYQMALNNVANTQASLTQVQADSEQLTTGLAVNEPSDSPQAAGEIVDLNSEIADDSGYTNAAQTGASQLNLTSTVLGEVMNLLNSVQTSAETGQNSSTENQSDLNSLATSVNSSLDQILNLANTQQGGQSIFAGYQVNDQAFSATTNAGGQVTAVTYNGDNGVDSAQVGTNTSVAVNIPGSEVFTVAGSSVFAAVIAISQALSAGNQTDLSAGVSQLQASMQIVTAAQAQAGSLDQALQTQESNLSTLQTGLQTTLGQVQNANQSEVATAYQQAVNTYDTGMEVAAQVAQLPSIVTYM